MNLPYKIIPSNDSFVSFLRYVQQEKIRGYMQTDLNDVYFLYIDDELASLLSIKFSLSYIKKADKDEVAILY